MKKQLTVIFIIFTMLDPSSFATEVTGEGYGQTLEQARKQALSALSEAISVEIKSNFESVETEKGLQSSTSQIHSRSNLPILSANIESYKRNNEYYCQAKLSSKAIKFYDEKIKKVLARINDIKSRLANKNLKRQQKYAFLSQAYSELDQLSKYQTVAYVLGEKNAAKPALSLLEVQSQLISIGTQADNLDFAADILTQKLKQKKVLISAANVEGTHEITALSRILRDKLAARLSSTSDPESAKYFFKGSYEIVKQGIHITYQMTDTKGTTIATRTVKLKPAAYKELAYKPQTTEFDRLLHQGIVVSNDFKVSINTNRGNENLLFTEGEEVELFIKLNRAGYFYVVSHVQNNAAQESYLLELSDAPAPRKFIQYVNADDANRWISLGKFAVSEPFGIESLQIIASNQDLSGKLPPFRYNNETELYMVYDGEPGEAIIRTRGLKPKRNKSKNIVSAEAVLMMTTFAK